MKEINKEIERIKVLKELGFKCQSELDRLFTKRDNNFKRERKNGNV